MKLRSVFSACSARSSHWCCSCSNFALVTGSAAASAAAAHLRANCRRYSDRALIQCSRRGLSRQIYIGSYCHGRFTWVHRTCSANEVSKKVPFPCWVSVASIGHNRANAISENEPSSEPECESDCEVRHHITLTPDREIGFRRWRAGT